MFWCLRHGSSLETDFWDSFFFLHSVSYLVFCCCREHFPFYLRFRDNIPYHLARKHIKWLLRRRVFFLYYFWRKGGKKSLRSVVACVYAKFLSCSSCWKLSSGDLKLILTHIISSTKGSSSLRVWFFFPCVTYITLNKNVFMYNKWLQCHSYTPVLSACYIFHSV